MGTTLWNSLGTKFGTFSTSVESGWHKAKCEKTLAQRISLNSKFEISSQIYFNNETAWNMGAVEIILYELVNGTYNQNARICIYDGHEAYIQTSIYADLAGKTVSNVITSNLTNLSGRYAIINNGTALSCYRGEKLISQIQDTANINIDKIEISYYKYDNSHNTPEMYIESLYMGEPFYYKQITGN